MTELAQPTARPRIASLDIIRGVAVMGIFSVNVVDFALIRQAYLNPAAAGGASGIDLALWFANYALIDGKMRTLFSILFGASILLVIDRTRENGSSPGRTHFARMAVLLLFGLLHFFLLWEGDILTLYAAVGMIAFFFRKARVRILLIWATILISLTAVSWSVASVQLVQMQQAVDDGTASPAEEKYWKEMKREFVADPARDARTVAIMRGPWFDRVEHFLTKRAIEPLGTIFQFGVETLGLMLIGMAAFRSGFLTGAWDDRRYRRIAIWTLGPGLLLSILLGIIVVASNFLPGLLILGLLGIGAPLHVAMALGYAALIILLARQPGRIAARLAAVGRMAFTNYLATSIIAASLFFGGGIALFGQLSRFEAWLVVPCIWLLMLTWSRPWLARFHYGPFEWIWRSLARGELQPLRKRLPAMA
ncbi:MAG TPA: DUF418 domain-containing protein [Sphingomicrobium sp.]|nr:DUF418 domain-containing protein [Sphingomicrobium sp.]